MCTINKYAQEVKNPKGQRINSKENLVLYTTAQHPS